jgi:gliding motility-associated-like protein
MLLGIISSVQDIESHFFLKNELYLQLSNRLFSQIFLFLFRELTNITAMKKIYLAVSIALGFAMSDSFAQCEITATASRTNITCGDCITLTAFGRGQGDIVFTEDFNSGAPTGWQSTSQATYTNPCSPGVDGTIHLWMGDAASVPRQMTTVGFDFSTAVAGATVCFDLLFATQGQPSPCEGPDEPDEGVYIQYSIDNGATWVTIHYFNPNGGYDPMLTNWNNWCFSLPPAALTSNTRIRWFQDNDSGSQYDHWGIDNVNIYFNDPTYEITWDHDGYSYGTGSAGGPNPNVVCPQETTTYSVFMTNGSSSCTDEITITVSPRQFRVTAEADTAICVGECVVLNSEATVIDSPAKTPTYSNNEVATITGFPSESDLLSMLFPCFNIGGCNCPNGSTVAFGATCPAIFPGSLSMNINVTDLNTTVLQNGELTRVCIGDAIMLEGNFSPFEVSLTCPSGSTIVLANAGDITGTTLLNTCFDLVATNPIANGADPYTGNWQPIDPLTALTGCDANGVWTMTLSGIFDLSSGTLPIGFMNGWNISFDDPEISYTGDFVWSPTTNMTDETSLTPSVCPTTDQTYTISVTDTAGCATVTADVTISIDPTCCPITFDAAITQPSCGSTDGSVTVTVLDGSGNYTYTWDAGGNSNTLSNIGTGSYTLTVYDIDLDCQRDTTIILTALNSPVIDNIATTDETCIGDEDGSAQVVASGGTGTLTYSWSNGADVALIENLAPGNYTVTVSDDLGCEAIETIEIFEGPSCCDFTFSAATVQPTCNNADGSITLTVSNGSGNYSYNWSNGGNTSSISNVSAGSYSVTITDLDVTPLCQKDTTIVLSDLGAPTIDNISATNETCAGDNDGTVTVSASGGTGTLTYTWQPGNLSGASQTGLAPGNYTVTVEDADGCESLSSVTVAAGPTCCDFDFDLTTVSESCFGLDNGSAEVNVSGGVAPYTVEWNGVVGNNTLEDLAPGNYTVSVTDADNCTETQTFVIQEGPLVEVSAGDDTSIFVGTPLQLNADVTNGTSGSFTWTPSADLSCNDCQSPVSTPLQNIVYTVVYNDDLGCSATNDVSVTVISDQPFCIFPDAFTPNNDNINDVFNGICQGMSFIEMRVYNRWGELVFQESGNLQINGWNGIYKGLEAPGEVYVFYVYIEYENGDSESVMGNVTLIR